ncbi:MICAL-like protein 2 isoform X2 [Cheilinus undulatus]|uniref:MICAL-like protein 2 isoform X2 n=1 Tax=Cheilinus undulatus TaxID=241271 RepID=UPI001BD54BC6|nr:MICAL-like protein 2 isoform X2 [Cheilinus undulatus]
MAAVKALQQWCRVQCEGYRDVNITNMTTSFRDGLAFCALIHKHRPDLINFDSLKKENVYDNNKLAFSVAEEQLGIPALLDAEDMVALRVPDRLSILTYVSQYYNYFHGRSPIGGMGGIKRPAEAPTGETPGKKNQPVTSKVFPSSKPARENSPPPSSNISRPAPSPKQTRNTKQDVPFEKPHQTGTLSSKCVSCNKHVHLVQRHLVDGKLYHRHCAKALSPVNTLTPFRDLPTNTALSKFTPLPDTTKTSTTTTPSRPGPSWQSEKPSATPTFSISTPAPSKHTSDPSPAAKESQPPVIVSKLTHARTTNESPPTTTTSVSMQPTPAPRTSAMAAKTLQSKLKFFQSDSTANEEEKKTAVSNFDFKKDANVSDKSKIANDTEKKTTATNYDFKKDLKVTEKVKIANDTEKKTSTTNFDFRKDPIVTDKVKTTNEKEKMTTTTNFDFKKDLKVPDKVKTTNEAEKKTTTSNSDFKKEWNLTDKIKTGKEEEKKTTTTNSDFKKDQNVSAANEKQKTGFSNFFFKKDSNVSDKVKTANEKEKQTTTINIDVKKDPSVPDKSQGISTGQPVTVVVNIGKKEANTGEENAAGEDSGKVSESSKSKASAAAFISKKLAEENNNNNSKPAWTNIALKKTDKPSEVETPKKETGGVRGRVRLRADRSILDDLQTPETSNLTPTPGGKRARTPDRPGSKPSSVSPNRSASENESPADWRSKLKPVSKETKPTGPPQSSPKPWTNGGGKTQTSEVSVEPSPSSHLSTPSISVTPPTSKGFLDGQKDQTTNGTKSESKIVKTKPDYIQKEDILKELQEIEDNLNELERRGVELEVRLRSSEEEGEDDSLMDELMVEWFNLIRNKQVAMRRESELVYIGRTQDLEEQQPSVEQELRRLMEKPERLKTAWDRKREEELMNKLMEIVNDRNAIVEGLDEDRIREEEEDEELNKMMRNFSIKKDKPKKKSPMSKLFGWGNKKEG